MFAIDKEASKMELDIPVYELKDIRNHSEKIDVVVVTAVSNYEEIKGKILNEVDIPVVSMKEIVVDMCKGF